MNVSLWTKVKVLAGAACMALGVGAAPAWGDDADVEALKARIERLEKQNERLLKAVEAGAVTPAAADAASKAEIGKLVDEYLKQQGAGPAGPGGPPAPPPGPAEPKAYEVGSDLKMTARWNRNSGVTLETANKDFTLHVGGRFQLDNVWWSEDEVLRPPTQLGNLQDGQFFRRVRLNLDGTFWEVCEFNLETALESVQQGIVGLDEYWVGVTYIPYIGTVRIGHQKIPQGFEGDSVSSSKAMTFLERASFSEAFYPNFATGLWTGNSVFDQHMTWSAMAYRQDRGSNGDDFADGEYAYSGRVTFLPYYENEGRCLLHLGASATWRNARKAVINNNPSGPATVRFSARPELRDASGDFGNTAFPSNPGNTSRMVDTNLILADNATVFGTELCGILGPFSLQAEWAWAFANDAVVGPGAATDTLGFHGGYVQASYFLTGEHRAYDRRLGRLASTYLVGPITPFWAVRDEETGGCCCGWGAWELAARWSYLDLNDGVIQGGIMKGVELGVNWYLNPNLKVQFEYMHNRREDKTTAPFGTVPGSVDGFGVRTQIFF